MTKKWIKFIDYTLKTNHTTVSFKTTNNKPFECLQACLRETKFICLSFTVSGHWTCNLHAANRYSNETLFVAAGSNVYFEIFEPGNRH